MGMMYDLCEDEGYSDGYFSDDEDDLDGGYFSDDEDIAFGSRRGMDRYYDD